MVTDTSREAEARQHEIFCRMSGEEKVRLAMALSDSIRDIALAGLGSRHPFLEEKALNALFIKEMYGIDLSGCRGKAT